MKTAITLIIVTIFMAFYAVNKYNRKRKRNSYLQRFADMYENELVIYDTETTGLNVENDDIIEISAVLVKHGEIIEEFDIMLEKHEGKQIPPFLGNIVNPMVEAYADPKNMKFDRKEGLEQFLDFVNKRPLLAHNVLFDYNILDNNLKRDALILTFKKEHPVFFDSKLLAKYLFPYRKSYSLNNLIKDFNIKGKNTHRAKDDVLATKELIDLCYNTIKKA